MGARKMAKSLAAAQPVEGSWLLPEGWRWEALGSFVSKGGASVTPARTPDDVFQVYSVPSHPTGHPETLRGCEIGSSKQSVAVDDVLLCKINPRINRVWKVADHGTGRLIASTEWIRFAANEAVDPDYLRYFLMRQEVRDYLAMNASGVGGSLMRVRPAVVEPIPFPLAPHELQRRIVTRIDELFAEIDDGEAALARARNDLATWRKALLKAAVTGELTADWRASNGTTETGTDFLTRVLADRKVQWDAQSRNRRKKYTIPDGPVAKLNKAAPEGWAFATIEQLAFVENGQTPKGIDALVQSGGDVPWFKVSSMNLPGNNEGLDNSTWWLSAESAADLGLRVHPAGSIVFPKRGGSIFTEKKRRLARPGAIDLNVMAVVPLADTADYLWTFFQNLSLRAISDGSNVPQINYDDVAQLATTVPPPNEAREIANRVNADLAVTAEAESELDELQLAGATLRQSILAAAFRGELA